MAFSSQIIHVDYINSVYAGDARPNPNEENVWFNLQDYLSVIQNINLNVFQEEVQEGNVQGEIVEIIIYRPENVQEVVQEQEEEVVQEEEQEQEEEEEEEEEEEVHEEEKVVQEEEQVQEQEEEQVQEQVQEQELDQVFDIQLYYDFINSLNIWNTPIILEELTKVRLNIIAYFCGIDYIIPEYELLLCLNYVKNHVIRRLASGSFTVNDILEHRVPQNSIYLFGSCDVCFESLYSQHLQIIICCRRQHAFHPTCIYGSTYYGVNSIDCQICRNERMEGQEEIDSVDEDIEREREIRERDAILEETWDQYYHNSGQEENVSEILELDNPEDELREQIEVIVEEEVEVEEGEVDDGFIPFLPEEAEGEESIYGSIAICEHSVVLCQPISADVFGDCPVCYDPIIAANITITRCGHIFHASCMFDAIIRKKNCPLCRTVLCF